MKLYIFDFAWRGTYTVLADSVDEAIDIVLQTVKTRKMYNVHDDAWQLRERCTEYPLVKGFVVESIGDS